jgi:hypothetical protein
MPRAISTFPSQAKIAKAAKALRAAGFEVVRTEIAPDGTTVFIHKAEARPPEPQTPYDIWKGGPDGPR